MNNKFKHQIIYLYFTFLYLYIYVGYKYFLIVSVFYILYIIVTLNKQYKVTLITIKLFLFLIFLFFFVIFDRLVVGIFLCGMDGVGYLQRSGILEYDHNCSNFTFYEHLLFTFLSSLHYPIYIFIFFKPFVNHLEKSIKNIKEYEK